MNASPSNYERDEAFVSRALLVGSLGLAMVLAIGTRRAIASDGGLAPPLLVLGGLGGFLLLLRAPESALYVLLGAAIVTQEQNVSFSLLDDVGLFRDLQASLDVPGLVANPIEMLAIGAFIMCLLRAREGGYRSLYLGPLLTPTLLFLVLLGWGVVQGVASGGDAKIALWGLRAPLILLLTSVLTANLLRRESHFRTLFLITTLGIVAKSTVALWRILVEFEGSLGRAIQSANRTEAVNSLVSHEDSFFFLLAIFLFVAACAFGLPRREMNLSLTAMLFSVVPLIANQRRTSIAAIILAAVVCVIVLLYLGRLRPRSVLVGLAVSSLVLLVYAGAFWNSASFLAMPVQAVKSGFSPDTRDASSNKYRDIENENLRATARESRYLGIGFGHQMKQVSVLPDISDVYLWYLYLPHNGPLWLLMTVGVQGLAAFAWFIWCAVRLHVLAMRENDRPNLRAAYLFGLMSIASYLVFILLDQGFVSQRIAIFVGIQLGLLGVVFEKRDVTVSKQPGVFHRSNLDA